MLVPPFCESDAGTGGFRAPVRPRSEAQECCRVRRTVRRSRTAAPAAAGQGEALEAAALEVVLGEVEVFRSQASASGRSPGLSLACMQ